MIWELIFLYSLLFFVLLHILGHPVLVLLEKWGAVENQIGQLDFAQKLPIEFVLGGLVVYIWAVIATPFKAFTLTNAWLLTIGFVVLYLVLTFIDPKRLKQLYAFGDLQSYSWLALAGLLLGLWIRVLPQNNFILGSINDSAGQKGCSRRR